MSEAPETGHKPPGKSLVKTVSRPVRSQRWPAWLALLLAVIALAAVIAGGILFSRQQQHTDRQLAAKLQRLDQRLTALSQSAAPRSELKNDAHNTRQSLKGFSDRLDSMQAALTALRRRSERGRDAWIEAEAATLLLAANDQVEINSNPQLALKALKAADARLKRLSDPQLIPVRQAIAKEVVALQAVPVPDVTGMAATLTSLSEAVPDYPLKRTAPVHYTSPARAASASLEHPTLWQRLGTGIDRVARDIFTVHHRNTPVEPLLTPSEEYFLRQNLALRMAAARAALLEHNGAAFHDSVKLASHWLAIYFDTSDSRVSAAIADLAKMQQQKINPPLPDISASLMLLRRLESPSNTAP